MPLDLLLALNAGVPGMCTLHANSAREALVKMCTLRLLAGENISARFVVPTVAASVDLLVHLGIDQHGVRRVNEIVRVPGRVENDVIDIESIFDRGDGGDLRRSGACLGVLPYLRDVPRSGRSHPYDVESSSPVTAATGLFGFAGRFSTCVVGRWRARQGPNLLLAPDRPVE